MASHHPHSSHSHYPHRNILPQPVPLVPPAPPPRIPELLDCVKQEFDNLHSESVHLKAQQLEFESHIGSSTSDLSLLREQFFELDRAHQKLKSQSVIPRLLSLFIPPLTVRHPRPARYEDELRRLHVELDQRPSTSAPPPPPHDPRAPPTLPQSGPPPPPSNSFGGIVNSSGPIPSGPHNGQGPSPGSSAAMAHHEPGFARDREPNYTNGAQQRGLPDGPIPDHPSKRLRTERDRPESELDSRSAPPPIGHNNSAGMASPPVLPNPSGRVPDSKNKLKPNEPQYSKLPNPSAPHGYANSYHPRAEGHMTAPVHHLSGPPALPAGSMSGPPAMAPAPAAGPPQTPAPSTNVLLDLDPDTLPSSMKKEGVDWMTMFNPKVKKVLDVGLVHTLVHDSVVCCVKFSPDGNILATGCNRHTALYNTRTGSKICTLLDESHGTQSADNYIRSASFSPDGKLLATGSEDRIIRIWDIAQKRIVNRFQGHKSEIYSLAFSPDGRMLVSGSGDKTARIWDMRQGSCLFHLVIEETGGAENGAVDAGVTSVCVSPDGSLLAAGSLDTVVRLWDTANGQLLDKLKGHKDSVYSVAFSPDGKFLVSGSLDKTLKLWDLATLNREGNPPGGSVVKKEEGENGEKVTSDRGFDPSRPSTQCTTTLTGHKDYVLSVAVSPDGEWIMSGSKDRGVQFWDPKTAMPQFMLQGHKNSVISIAVSDSGGLLATGSGDWHARIWSYERIGKK